MTNILIVDDEEKICEFIKAFLDNEGYYADVAYDGKSAIDKINSKKYDLIILDRMLPYVFPHVREARERIVKQSSVVAFLIENILYLF